MKQAFTAEQPMLDAELARPGAHRTSFLRTLLMWLAADLVVTTMLTGTLFVPSLTLLQTLIVIGCGTVLGAVVLILVGNMGTRTGLPTMAWNRGSPS